MHTKQEARAKMKEFIAFENELYQQNFPGKYTINIIDSATEDHPFGWIFYYGPVGDTNFQLAGNGPVIVEKKSLDMYQMMTALPVEENIKIYLDDKSKLGRLVKNDEGIWDRDLS